MKLSQQIYYTFYYKKKIIMPEYYSPKISIFNTLSSFFFTRLYMNFFLFNLKQILPHDPWGLSLTGNLVPRVRSGDLAGGSLGTRLLARVVGLGGSPHTHIWVRVTDECLYWPLLPIRTTQMYPQQSCEARERYIWLYFSFTWWTGSGLRKCQNYQVHC